MRIGDRAAAEECRALEARTTAAGEHVADVACELHPALRLRDERSLLLVRQRQQESDAFVAVIELDAELVSVDLTELVLALDHGSRGGAACRSNGVEEALGGPAGHDGLGHRVGVALESFTGRDARALLDDVRGFVSCGVQIHCATRRDRISEREGPGTEERRTAPGRSIVVHANLRDVVSSEAVLDPVQVR